MLTVSLLASLLVNELQRPRERAWPVTNCRYIPRGTESNLYGVMVPASVRRPWPHTIFISISARIAQVYTQT